MTATPDTLLMLSGGLDSTLCLWKRVQQGLPTRVHHVVLSDADGRQDVESRAVREVLAWMNDHGGEGLIEYTESAPALPGAKCRHRHHLFDEAAQGEPAEVVEQRHAQALGLCRICPALASCQIWFTALPSRKRPPGVVAGTINPKPVGRPSAAEERRIR